VPLISPSLTTLFFGVALALIPTPYAFSYENGAELLNSCSYTIKAFERKLTDEEAIQARSDGTEMNAGVCIGFAKAMYWNIMINDSQCLSDQKVNAQDLIISVNDFYKSFPANLSLPPYLAFLRVANGKWGCDVSFDANNQAK
tara:strand:+ start:512 stop:940 length:429 start_codon:yes stop_codon:yes gene_type:complete